MESTVSATTLFTLTKTLNSSSKPFTNRLHRHFSRTHQSQILQRRFSPGKVRCICNGDFQSSNEFISISSSGTSLRSLYSAVPISSRSACISSSAASFASGGGGDGFHGKNRGGGNGGDGGSSGGEAKSKSVAGESDEVSAFSPDVIIIDVGGMTCGGCAASVKRILENQVYDV
ncbi:hypothetical protein HHK36_009479 [Tetracentron sinense]|uniref:HMA domain-containing protein n=1 Tax=Tetracentron sinense TaxID=13715 RepID=A0A834ZCW6_TETSI|nr:hypothetical protein HHK36_009479 [Tetracentron sinense]